MPSRILITSWLRHCNGFDLLKGSPLIRGAIETPCCLSFLGISIPANSRYVGKISDPIIGSPKTFPGLTPFLFKPSGQLITPGTLTTPSCVNLLRPDKPPV